MIDLFLRYATDPAAGPELSAALEALGDTAGRGEPDLVEYAERAVRADPDRAFAFDADGFATLDVGTHRWHAGRFETPTIAELRRRVGGPGGRIRLWVLDGGAPATDIGGLQATAADGALFQAASQFNCLESPGPYVTPVTSYFRDPTQGPRASISAFPATLLRHYAAPSPGGRFVQTDETQLNLLADAFGPDVVRVQSGYLMARNVRDPRGLVNTLASRFEQIRVGVHAGAQVVLGFDFEGSVSPPERRIAQVFTSTFAGGGYGGGSYLADDDFDEACKHLLRAAYLGTLLAAAGLGCRQAVLTLIGGGVFGNPIPLIWESILWAIAEAEPLTPRDMDVVVNGRNLGADVSRETILAGVRPRGGALLWFDRGGLPVVSR